MHFMYLSILCTKWKLTMMCDCCCSFFLLLLLALKNAKSKTSFDLWQFWDFFLGVAVASRSHFHFYVSFPSRTTVPIHSRRRESFIS